MKGQKKAAEQLPKIYVVTHRCRVWRLNVYRRWKAQNPGKS